jgi:hypothetical protein
MKYREEADYTAASVYTSEDVRRFRAEVAAVSASIDELIRESGLTR